MTTKPLGQKDKSEAALLPLALVYIYGVLSGSRIIMGVHGQIANRVPFEVANT